ncbi:MAG: hypothetical protein SPJ13_08210, partial [Bacteroidales bacterium]|nr:hypothetical protein [Bacteroidales bacterium]
RNAAPCSLVLPRRCVQNRAMHIPSRHSVPSAPWQQCHSTQAAVMCYHGAATVLPWCCHGAATRHRKSKDSHTALPLFLSPHRERCMSFWQLA